jgi:hypothetical protein
VSFIDVHNRDQEKGHDHEKPKESKNQVQISNDPIAKDKVLIFPLCFVWVFTLLHHSLGSIHELSEFAEPLPKVVEASPHVLFHFIEQERVLLFFLIVIALDCAFLRGIERVLRQYSTLGLIAREKYFEGAQPGENFINWGVLERMPCCDNFLCHIFL